MVTFRVLTAELAERLSMPLLMCLADRDLQASSRFAARVAAGAQHVEIHHHPLGHFDVYLGEAFERISDAQLAFLRTHLRASVGEPAATGGQEDEPQARGSAV